MEEICCTNVWAQGNIQSEQLETSEQRHPNSGFNSKNELGYENNQNNSTGWNIE